MKSTLPFLASLFIISCIVEPAAEPKIIGGQPASQPYEFFVGIYEDPDVSVCGASLIAHNIALTAAHCVSSGQTHLRVGIGLQEQNSYPDESQMRDVLAVAIHPDYNEDELSHDIALLLLQAKDGDEIHLKPAQLSQQTAKPQVDQSLRVIGHGNMTSVGWLEDHKLREVDLPVVADELCEWVYGDLGEQVFCLGHFLDGGQDSCQGDSGGPVFFPQTGGKASIVGLVSNGRDCAQKSLPGVYVHVASYLDWIEKETQFLQSQAAVSKENFALYMQRYCYRNITTYQATHEDVMSVYFRDWLGNDAELITESEDFSGIQERDDLGVLGTCRISPPGQDGVDIIFTQARNSDPKSPVYRNFVKVEEQWYEIRRKLQRQLRYVCADKQNNRIVAVLEAGSQSLWYLDIGEDEYYGEELNKEDIAGLVWDEASHCAIDQYQLSLYHNSKGIFASIMISFDEETRWYQLLSYDEVYGYFEARLSYEKEDRGIIEIFNPEDTDLYTWSMSCDFAFSLQDRWGVNHEARLLDNGQTWVVDFVAPEHPHANIAKSHSRSFLISLPDTKIADIPDKYCDINNLTLKFELSRL
ncbi:MAG: S1 family peptidase [Oligoflexus sp.]